MGVLQALTGELVGERSGRESHAHRHWAVGGPVGGVGRHDPAVAKGLNMFGQKTVKIQYLGAAGCLTGSKE